MKADKFACQARGCKAEPDELIKRTEFKGNADTKWYCSKCWDKRFASENVLDVTKFISTPINVGYEHVKA